MIDAHDVPRLFAVVPAAGQSRRMGRPKLLLPLGGQTIIARMLAVLARPGIAATVVVVRPDDEPLRAAVAECGAIALQPAVPPADMRQSVEHGLRYLEREFHPGPNEGWLLAPADHPLLEARIVDQVIRAWRGTPEKIFVPVHQGRRGHPTIFPFRLADEVFALPPDQGLNSLVHRHAAEVELLQCDSPAVVADLDTPEDYARLRGEFEEKGG